MWLKDAKEPDGKPRHLYPSVGLPVTLAIKYQDFYIEDAGYPVLLDWLLAAKSGLVLRAAGFLLQYLWARVTGKATGQLGSRLAFVLGDGEAEAASMPLGAMGLDKPDGTMTLGKPRRFFFFRRHKRLQVDWREKNSAEYFKRVEVAMRDIGKALDGTVDPSALSRLGRTITVHPLGGCPMGDSARTGVVDEFGRVYGYHNLFIADGSVMPAPIGANPSLTIAAFSNRMVEAILEEENRKA
jgi:cholesterol oxidase